MAQQVFWLGLVLVIFLAIVALNLIEKHRRSYLSESQKQHEDEEVERLMGEW